jgi:hypothetical protein
MNTLTKGYTMAFKDKDVNDFDTEDTVDSSVAMIRLSRDLKDAAGLMSPVQQRVFVDLYYQIQENRKRAFNQLRAAEQEPNAFVTMFAAYLMRLEKTIVSALDASTEQSAVSRWAKSLHGVGPILAAGFAAHIDITRTPSAAALQRFAGIDPTLKWYGAEESRRIVTALVNEHKDDKDFEVESLLAELAEIIHYKPETLIRLVTRAKDVAKTVKLTQDMLIKVISKRPWNARLKVLQWKFSSSMNKFHNHPKCYYGHIYAARKIQEITRNDAGANIAQAQEALDTRKFSDANVLAWYQGCYPAGTTAKATSISGTVERDQYLRSVKLPPGQGQQMHPLGRLELRARRYCSKRFLCHYWEVAFEDHYKKEAPLPYILVAQPELHTKYEPPPGWVPPF